ncbi:MAG: LPS-assembly protein LptD, partial [Actinobacteria bacterium]|nr:LPS-assembly protein LptD [Actinomycetota bacterium]
AIDKSNDATIALDVETAARVGAIGEYRYAWSKETKGVVTGGYFNESIGGNPEPIQPLAPGTLDTPTNRWIVAARHTQPFVLDDSHLYLDVLRVSDDQFLREIDAFATTVRQDIQIRSTRITRSRLGTVKTWQGGGMQLEGAAYQDLIDPQELALNRVPRITAEHAMPLWGGAVVPRLAGQTDYFQRTDAFDGLRLDLAPDVTFPFNAGRYLFGSLRGQVRETAYHLNDDEQMAIVIPNSESISPTFRAAPELPRLDTNHTREIGRVDGRLATEVSKVFKFPYFGYEKLRHSIEPELQYLFVPQVDRQLFQQALGPCRVNPNNPSRLARGEQPGVNCEATLFSEGYLFDEIDAIDRRNFFSYGVTTRLFGRGATADEVTARAAATALDAADTGELDVRAEAEEAEEEEDEDDDGEPFDAVDAETYPQGLPAVLADRPVARPRPRAAAKPTTKAAIIPGSTELLRASVLQGYDFSREISGSSHFSDVDFNLRLTPIHYLGFSYLTSIDLNEGRTLAQSIGAFIREPWWQPPPGRVSFQVPSSVAVAYRFIADNLNSGLTPGTAEERLLRNNAVEGIDGSAYLRLGDYLGFLFLARYDLSTTLAPDPDKPLQLRRLGPHFLERDYILRVMSRCDCWLLELGVSDRFDTDETTFRVQFTLYGLGSFGQGRARSSYAALPGLQNIGYKRPFPTGVSQ